ncbi:MAG: HAMP domain-containing protein, partial [Ignavibacteriae bacterium]|nr:HAMP domain-containing protein [Ignavibacteriota bacterium]
MSPSQNNGVNHKPRVVRFTIYRKMMLGFAVIILLMIIANVYVLFELYSVTKTTEMTLTSNVRSIDLAKQIQAILFEEERYARKYFISLDTAYFTLFNDQSKRVEPYINAVIAAETKQPELELINRVREGHDWLLTAIREEHDSVRTPAVNEPNINARVHSDSLEAYQASLDQFIRLNQISISNSMANVGTAMIRSSNVAYLLTVGALLVALTVALFIASTITKPIGILIKGTDRIARGAFDPISVSSRDEIALLTTAVNDMSGKLRRVNELKTELMHHLSHELRTPLQAMLSAQDLLAQHKVGPLTNEQARLLNSIKEGISKLLRFSNQFLDISKIEEGKMLYNFVLADIVG